MTVEIAGSLTQAKINGCCLIAVVTNENKVSFVALSFYKDIAMATITVLCPACQQDKVIKFGKSPEGKQRYRCLYTPCKKNTFLLDYSYNGHKPGTKEKIIEMALNTSGVRDTARVLKVSVNTVIGTIKKSRSIGKRQPKISRKA